MYKFPVLAGARCNGEERMVVVVLFSVLFVGVVTNAILRDVTLLLLLFLGGEVSLLLSPRKLLSTDLDRIRGCWSEIVENFYLGRRISI